MKIPRIILSVSVVLFASFNLLAAPEGMNDKLPIKVNVGDMEFKYGFPGGMQLSVYNIPIISSNDICAVTPDWSEVFYVTSREKSNADKKFEIKPFGKGKQVIIYHKSSKGNDSPFSAKEIFTLLPDNTITIQNDFVFESDNPGLIQWQVGRIVPMAFIAKEYRAKCIGDKVVTGVVPFEAQHTDFDKATFAKNFSTMTFQTKFGSMVIEADLNDKMCVSDYRKNRWGWQNPSFWFGVLERKLFKGKGSMKTTVRFNRKPSLSRGLSEIEISPNIKKVENANRPYWGNDFIIPTPKNLAYTQDKFPLSEKTKIYVGQKPSRAVLDAVGFFTTEFKTNFKLNIPVIEEEAPANASNVIIVGEKKRYSQPAGNCCRSGVSVPAQDEGYSLVVDNNQASVAANNARGVLYGITSLVQLAKLSGKDLFLQGAKIADYPSLNMRAIHFIVGKDSDQIKKAIRTLMARFKINTLFWQCEYIKWDSTKGIHHERYGLDKTEARKILDSVISKYSMEVIPLIPTMGHVKWMFHNGQNLDLAEDPDLPYAYCPTNPDTYKFIFPIFQEAIDFFDNPRYFHIGHDEITLTARFPYKSKFTGKTATELMVDDIKKIRNWFSEKDIKVMIWGDMFLTGDVASSSAYGENPQEATKGRNSLPKDIVVCDWHYSPAKPDEFISLKAFKKAGLKTIGCGWDNPENIQNFNKACFDFDTLGYMQTTWAGYEFDVDGKRHFWPQFWAYVLGAEYSWTGGKTPVAELPFNAPTVFTDLWNETKPELDNKKGYLFDLAKVYNCSLEDNTKLTGWLGFGPGVDLSAFPVDKKFFEKTQFVINKTEKGNSAVILASQMNPEGNYPKSIRIKTGNISASEINLLLTATFKTRKNKNIGSIKINYEDGSFDTTQLKYGVNIFAFDEMGIAENLRIAWHGSTKSRKAVFINQLKLKTDPCKKISSITIESKNTETAPVIIAITAVE